MIAVGADVKFRDGASQLAADPVATLDVLEGLGLRGILVRALDDAFPTLDAGDIARFARAARDRGFVVRVGLGKINPYMTAELPRIRRLGEGSYLAGMERMLRVCAENGWLEAWTATGGYKPQFPAPFCFDRFRTDVGWAAQLEATRRFLERLAPALRATGVRLNVETHEEITTHEILRLVEAVGPDLVGVCLDPANLPVRGEAFLPAARRVAPYTHLTHLRDAVLVRGEGGIARHLAPIGRGQIDWPALLAALSAAPEDAALFIEGVGGTRARMLLAPDDPAWWAAHPDLDAEEIAEIARLAEAGAADPALRDGFAPLAADAREDHLAFLRVSLDALRGHLDARNP
jgi:sugar phosphate isomerase/epimerase